MANYNFDVAFNWNALPDPDNDNKPLLSIGLATFGQPAQISNQFTFTAGQDSFCFNGFNQTPGATQASHSISSGSVTFTPAVAQTTTSPISEPSLTIGSLASTGTGPSDVFPGSNYPNFCPLLGLQPVTNSGSFFFTVLLTVVQNSDGSTKEFRVDPEMIVEAGPPPTEP